jgi:hypothetical protein
MILMDLVHLVQALKMMYEDVAHRAASKAG